MILACNLFLWIVARNYRCPNLIYKVYIYRVSIIKLEICEPSSSVFCEQINAAKLHENGVMEKWNDGNFIERKKNTEFQKTLLGGVKEFY